MHSQAKTCSPRHRLWVRAGPAPKQHWHTTLGSLPCCENPRSHTPTAPAMGGGAATPGHPLPSTQDTPPQHPAQAGLPSGSTCALSPCHSRGVSHPSRAQHPPAPLPSLSRATDTTRKVFLTPPTPLLPFHREKEDRFMLLIHFIYNQNFQKPTLAIFFFIFCKGFHA